MLPAWCAPVALWLKKQLAIWRAKDWLGYNSFIQLIIYALISGNQKGLPNIIIIEIQIWSLINTASNMMLVVVDELLWQLKTRLDFKKLIIILTTATLYTIHFSICHNHNNSTYLWLCRSEYRYVNYSMKIGEFLSCEPVS